MSEEPRSMWESSDRLEAYGIDVPRWAGAGHSHEPLVYDVAAIVQGGCGSGAWMPAVTYHTAAGIMAEHGDDVLQFIQDTYGELPKPRDEESWGGIAVFYLSTAVELWAGQAAGELTSKHGFEEV